MPITQATRVGQMRQRRARKMRLASLARGDGNRQQKGGAWATPARFLSSRTHVPDFAYVDTDESIVHDAKSRLMYADRLTRSKHPFRLELVALEEASRRQSEKERRKAETWARAAQAIGRESSTDGRAVNPARVEIYRQLIEAKARVSELERKLKDTP